MTFYMISSPDEVINQLAGRLSDRLDRHQRVLWLLSGGSAIALEVAVAKKLKGHARLANLTISLADERYGPVGHPDSNWQQLLSSGFNLPGAHLEPVLNGLSMTRTLEAYEDMLRHNFETVDFVLAVAGLGADGHTLGIKPNSPALASPALATGYEWEDYRRITATAEAIKQMDEIAVYAVGAEKKDQLEKLAQALAPAEQPAQLLKLCSQVLVFNDQIGQPVDNEYGGK